MKNRLFASFVIILGLGTVLTSPLSTAQEVRSTEPAVLAQMIAPLVDNQTTLILHIDLTTVDFDKLTYELMLFSEKAPGAEDLNPTIVTQRRVSIQKNLSLVFRDNKKIREQLINEVGLKDIFLLAYHDLEEVSFVVAASLEGRSGEQRKAFARIIRSQYPILLGAQGFMLGVAPSSPLLSELAEKKVRDKMKNIQPLSRDFLTSAFSVNKTSTLTMIGIPYEGEPTYIARIPKMFHLSEPMMQIARLAAKKFLWTSIGIDFGTLTINMVGEAGSEQDAAVVREEVNQRVDQLIPEEQRSQKGRTPEQIQALLRSFEPVQSGNRLTVTLSQTSSPSLGFVLVPLIFGLNISMQTAWVNQCTQNLQVIRQGFEKYREEHGVYPPAWTADAEGRLLHSWRVLILPYLGEEELYTQISLDEPWNGPLNRKLHNKMPLIYRCPSNPSATDSTTTYTLIVGNPAFPDGPVSLKEEDIKDAKKSTVLVTERRTPVSWMKPEEVLLENANFESPKGLGSHHGLAGVNAIYFDGSVRYVRREIRSNILRAMLTLSGGEVFDFPKDSAQ